MKQEEKALPELLVMETDGETEPWSGINPAVATQKRGGLSVQLEPSSDS